MKIEPAFTELSLGTDLPMALAELHRDLAVDDEAEIAIDGSDLSGHLVENRREEHLRDLFTGAGFEVVKYQESHTTQQRATIAILRRMRSLPDTVGPDMTVLICGLNPSLHSADMAVGFGRGGNRFWPAALAAGLVTIDRDPHRALADHGVGMTDLVKRATPRADAISRDEFADGVGRLERLCDWLRPRAVCMVGLAGWRAAVERKAVAGWQDRLLGGSPVYVMPSTSGLNAHSRLDDLTEHLRTAAAS